MKWGMVYVMSTFYHTAGRRFAPFIPSVLPGELQASWSLVYPLKIVGLRSFLVCLYSMLIILLPLYRGQVNNMYLCVYGAKCMLWRTAFIYISFTSTWAWILCFGKDLGYFLGHVVIKWWIFSKPFQNSHCADSYKCVNILPGILPRYIRGS